MERTTEEAIEQLAHNIIASCEIIKGLAAKNTFPGMARVYSSARSAQFHAEGILSSELERLEL